MTDKKTWRDIAGKRQTIDGQFIDQGPIRISYTEKMDADNEEIGWVLDRKHLTPCAAKSLDEWIEVCKRAHMVDVDVRVGGKNVIFEADWIKYMKKAELP